MEIIMKKTKLARTIAVVLSVVIIMASVAVFSASATVYPPENPHWDGTNAAWTEPSSGDYPSYYGIDLYKDYVWVDYVAPAYTDHLDFYPIMDMLGPGDYYFTIYSVGPAESGQSATVSSGIYHYGSSTTHTMVQIGFSYPTCTEDGEKGHFECTDCGKWFWDKDGNYEIIDHSETKTPAYGHKWGDWVITKDPTTTSEGEAKRVCQNDYDHVEYKTIPKLKSADDTPTVPPTDKPTEPPTTAVPTVPFTTDPNATLPQGITLPTLTTMPTDGQGGIGGFIHDNPWVLFVGIGVFLLILIATPIIIVLIIVNKRKKARKNNPTPPNNQPPTSPAPPRDQPPMNPNNNQPQSPYGNPQPQNQDNYDYPINQPQNYPPQNYQQQNQAPQNYPPQNYQQQNQAPHNYPPQNYQQQNQAPQNYPPQNYPPQNQPPQNPSNRPF